MRKYLILFFPLLALVLCSCASSDRMLACSPFSINMNPLPLKEVVDGLDSGEFKEKRPKIAEHVNVCPLYYSRDDIVSVLLPIFDYDSRGMAARPFFNKHNQEYSILFPLCAWNPENGDGWIANYSWDKQGKGFFPLAYSGAKGWYVFPVWKKKDSFGLIPFWFNQQDRNWGLFPFVYQNNEKEGWIFPLYYFKNEDEHFRINFLFYLLGHYEKNPDGKSANFINFIFKENAKSKFHSFFPLYYYSEDADSTFISGIFPLTGYSYSSDQTSYKHWILPLYLYGKDGEKSSLFTPLFIKSDDLFWCPLYNQSNNWFGIMTSFFWHKDWTQVFILPLLSGWWSQNIIRKKTLVNLTS